MHLKDILLQVRSGLRHIKRLVSQLRKGLAPVERGSAKMFHSGSCRHEMQF
jgi:hypothetical protein